MSISAHKPEPVARNDALENYVACFKLAHDYMPRPQTLARIGLSLGMNVAEPKRILENAEMLAEQLKGSAVERAAQNGDVATAMTLIKLEKDRLGGSEKSSPCQSSAPPKRERSFDPLLVIAYPLMLINGLCAFLLMCAFNVCIAIAKTFKGETVK